MIQVILALVAVIIALGGVASCEHKEVVALKAEKKAIQEESNRLIKARSDENKKALEGYIQYARESDTDYEKRIAALRAAAKSGSVFHDKGSCTGGQGTAGSAGTPEVSPAGQGTVSAPREVALGEVEVSKVLGWYVYAESCHQYVYKPIRERLRGTP